MTKKIIYLVLAFIGFVVVAVIFNYLVAQKSIRETKSSILETSVISYPEITTSGSTGTFFWNVNTPNDLIASTTSIYWSYDSTPSAVTENDPPESLNYPNHTQDYLVGQFKLPDTFDSQITFDKPGKIFFRSYAKVGNLHLWSREYTVTVNPNSNVQKK